MINDFSATNVKYDEKAYGKMHAWGDSDHRKSVGSRSFWRAAIVKCESRIEICDIGYRKIAFALAGRTLKYLDVSH